MFMNADTPQTAGYGSAEEVSPVLEASERGGPRCWDNMNEGCLVHAWRV